MRLLGIIFDSVRHRKKLREEAALLELKARYHAFRIFLENNGRALELIVLLDALLNRGAEEEIRAAAEELSIVTGELVDGLNLLSGERYADLYALHGMMASEVADRLSDLDHSLGLQDYCVALDDLDPGTTYLTGAKAANLARLRRLGLPVPGGFACTTRAFKTFLHQGRLADDICRLLEQVKAERVDIYAAAAEVREMVLATPLPDEIAEALAAAYRQLESREAAAGDGGHLAISVRSSGVAEDGAEHSFAGQFTSILNVRGTEALGLAYREVVASSFSARAISYRQNAGLPVVDFNFAVLCQAMAEAECAGVLFTRDPSQPDSGRMVISAVPGLGTTAVGGSTTTDLYRPARRTDRSAAAEITEEDLYSEAEISRKTVREVPAAGGGVILEQVPADEAEAPLLTADTLRELVAIGELIESLEGITQDIEWACSAARGLAILQARPLRLAVRKDPNVPVLPDQLPQQPILSGTCAVAGKAVGQARLVRSAAELREVEKSLGALGSGGPNSAILVLPQSIVDAVPLMPKCVGIVIEVGNPTDHLSCIAREYGIPMITGVQSALSGLQDGQWLVLDAERGQIFAASEPLIADIAALHAKYQNQPEPRPVTPEQSTRRGGIATPERQTLRKMIVPLNLTDAYGATFSRAECRSIHDIVRYTHEMAVLAMFDTGDMIMEQAGGLLRPLDIGVPFSFLVIDVGGGVRKGKNSSWRRRLAIHRPLFREDILSFPLAALCDGLTTPGLSWHSGPDVEALPGIFSRSLLDSRGARPAGSFNYALAARDYLNLNARVEFHFAMLDTVCGRDSHANYIRFRFKGGGAGIERGRRRADFLRYVFEKNSFYTSVAGDLITASLTGASKEIVSDKLIMIGRLLGFSRFLDGVMTTENTPVLLAQAFLAGDYAARDHLPPEGD